MTSCVSQKEGKSPNRKLHLFPVDASIDHFTTTISDERRLQVEELVIHTFPEPNWIPPLSGYDEKYHSYRDWHINQEWLAAITLLSSCTNLHTVTLSFTSMCSSPSIPDDLGGEQDVPESTGKRRMILTAISTALARCNSDNQTKIRSVCIRNLQNLRFEIDNELLSAAMAHLETFDVLICTEYGKRDNITQIPDYRCFWPYFFQQWLQPISKGLISLSLYCDIQWGSFPGAEKLQELTVPILESLSLGNYVFAYDWQMNWILKHQTLRSITFSDCGILCLINVYPDGDDSAFAIIEREGLVDIALEDLPGNNDVLKCEGRWNDYFRRLQELPLLAEFRFGSTSPNGQYVNPLSGEAFDRREEVCEQLSNNRFYAFSDGWIEPVSLEEIGSGADMWGDHFVSLGEDREDWLPRLLQDRAYFKEELDAYRELCETVAARRQSSLK